MTIAENLNRLKAAEKFRAEAFYPGAPNEKLRVEAEQSVNTLLDRLIPALRTPADKQFVLQEFRRTLDAFTQSDTEERERLCGYLEEIMDIVGIESSDGLLNDWLYGFNPQADVIAPEPSIAQAWSDPDMQTYAYIESQLEGAESRRDALLALPRSLQIFYLSLIVEAEAMNCNLAQFFTNLSDYTDLIAPALRELSCEPAALIFEQAAAKRAAHQDIPLEWDKNFRSEAGSFPALRSKLLRFPI